MGHLSGMSGGANATAQYNPAGQVTSMTYDSFGENRSYNTPGQLTSLTSGPLSMQYVYSATQNNGRIIQAIDGMIE